MKLVTKVVAVLAALALATPALACGDKEHTTKSAEAKSSSSKTVAKSGEKKATSSQSQTQTKQGQQAKPATATN